MNAVRVSSAVLCVLLARIPVAGALCFRGEYALAVGMIILTEAILVAAALVASSHSSRPVSV